MSLSIIQPTSTGTPFPANCDSMYHIVENEFTSSMFNPYYQISVQVTGQNSYRIRLKLYEPTPVSPTGVSLNLKDYLRSQVESVIVNEITAPEPYNEWLLVTIGIKSFYYTTPSATTAPVELNSTTITNRCWNGVARFNETKDGLQNVYNKFLAKTPPPFASADDQPRPLGYKSLIPYIIDTSFMTFPRLEQVKKYAYKTNLNTYRTACYPMWGGVLDTQYWEFYDVITFTKNGTPNKLFIYQIPSYSMNDSTRFYNFPVGVQNLNSVNWLATCNWGTGGWTAPTATPLIIDETDYYYLCIPLNRTYQFTARPLFFEIRHCTQLRHKEYALLYKTFDGGWNEIDVHGNFNRNVDIQTTVMNNVYPVTPSKWMREKNVTNVQATGKWVVNTEWLDQARVDECNEMFLSPIIYLCDFSDVTPLYIPVTKSNEELTDWYVRKDKLVNYTITLDEAYTDNTIRR